MFCESLHIRVAVDEARRATLHNSTYINEGHRYVLSFDLHVNMKEILIMSNKHITTITQGGGLQRERKTFC